jgi:hypothetical protein
MVAEVMWWRKYVLYGTFWENLANHSYGGWEEELGLLSQWELRVSVWLTHFLIWLHFSIYMTHLTHPEAVGCMFLWNICTHQIVPNAKGDHHLSNNCWEDLKTCMVDGVTFILLHKGETVNYSCKLITLSSFCYIARKSHCLLLYVL